MSKAPKITTSSMLHDDSKALFQPWRHGAFKSDIFVQAMKPVERWMYATLLHESFDYSTRPYLPDDDSLLWMLAGCESKKQWDQHKESVRFMFTPVVIDGQKLLGQKRALDDWQRLAATRVARTESARVAGLASAAKRQRHVDDTSTKSNETSTKSNQGKGSEGKGSEGKKRTREERGSEVSSDVNIGEPTPSLLSDSPAAGLAPPQEGGQETTDVAMIQAACFDLVGKTPKAEHVEALLRSYRRPEILNAFTDYIRPLSDDDRNWAEKVFFADGGATGVILYNRQKDWMENIKFMGESAEQESVDEWLADNPPPVGITAYDARFMIGEAKKNRAKVDAEYYAKNSTTAESVTGDKS